jgi:hypothetical protein
MKKIETEGRGHEEKCEREKMKKIEAVVGKVGLFTADSCVRPAESCGGPHI